MKNAFLYLFILLSYQVFSQHFEEEALESTVLFMYEGDFFGGGISFFDVNKDGLEDITVCNAFQSPSLYINLVDSFELTTPIDSSFQEIKGFVWVDFDNDGDYDFSCAEINGQIRLFRQNDDFSFTEISNDAGLISTLPESNFGLSWADLNSDGLLDLYVSRYVNIATPGQDPQENILFLNNGDETFTDVTLLSGTGDGFQASFQTSVFDFDSDGDQDIFIINDRVAYDNGLYSNNGDSTFTYVSGLTQMDLAFDAMTNTVADYNHDGYFDVYCTNNGSGNYLFQWNPDQFYFENLFPNSGAESYDFNWGACTVDYNNDSWEDLVVTSNSAFNKLFKNIGGTFELEESTLGLDNSISFSVAKGDYNNDFKSDIFICNDNPHRSRLFKNTNDEGLNALKVSFEGTISNRDAIGTIFTYYLDSTAIKRMTFCGTNYMNQESQYHLLGMNSKNEIDSLHILWPSGIEEWKYDLEAYNSYHFIENTVLQVNLTNTGIQTICNGDSIQTGVDIDFLEITWNSGALNTDSILINQSGFYYASGLTTDSVVFQTDTLQLIVNQTPILDSLSLTHPTCYEGLGSAEFFTNPNNSEFVLETNADDLDSLTANNYSYVLTSTANCILTGTFEIIEPDELILITNSQNVSCFNSADGEITFNVFGGSEPIEITTDSTLNYSALNADTYVLLATDINGCQVSDSVTLSEPDSLYFTYEIIHSVENEPGSVGISGIGGTPPYNFFINDQQVDSVSIHSAGEVCISISDAQNCVANEICDSILTLVSVNGLELSRLILYPNPVKDKLILKNLPQAQTIEIYSNLGKLERLYQFSTELDVSNLEPGNYVLLIKENQTIKSRHSFIKVD